MEGLYRLCENTIPFYIKNLGIQGFWYTQGVLERTPCGYHELVLNKRSLKKPCKIPTSKMNKNYYEPVRKKKKN